MPAGKVTTPSLRERLRAQLADLKLPGALEALDDILAALEALLGAQIALRNNRRLQAAMRSSRLPPAFESSPGRSGRRSCGGG